MPLLQRPWIPSVGGSDPWAARPRRDRKPSGGHAHSTKRTSKIDPNDFQATLCVDEAWRTKGAPAGAGPRVGKINTRAKGGTRRDSSRSLTTSSDGWTSAAQPEGEIARTNPGDLRQAAFRISFTSISSSAPAAHQGHQGRSPGRFSCRSRIVEKRRPSQRSRPFSAPGRRSPPAAEVVPWGVRRAVRAGAEQRWLNDPTNCISLGYENHPQRIRSASPPHSKRIPAATGLSLAPAGDRGSADSWPGLPSPDGGPKLALPLLRLFGPPRRLALLRIFRTKPLAGSGGPLVEYRGLARDWFNGRTTASQAVDTGSIPVSRFVGETSRPASKVGAGSERIGAEDFTPLIKLTASQTRGSIDSLPHCTEPSPNRALIPPGSRLLAPALFPTTGGVL
ncbi:hypothetical protein BH23PLA1_BH23PLA1_00590 [soil metagenome]